MARKPPPELPQVALDEVEDTLTWVNSLPLDELYACIEYTHVAYPMTYVLRRTVMNEFLDASDRFRIAAWRDRIDVPGRLQQAQVAAAHESRPHTSTDVHDGWPQFVDAVQDAFLATVIHHRPDLPLRFDEMALGHARLRAFHRAYTALTDSQRRAVRSLLPDATAATVEDMMAAVVASELD